MQMQNCYEVKPENKYLKADAFKWQLNSGCKQK
jgi:hypothetical protein